MRNVLVLIILQSLTTNPHSIPEAVKLGKELGVHAIPAVEANAWHEETQTNVHILCYYPIDTDRLRLFKQRRLKKLSDAVIKSYQSLIDEYPITMEQLYEVSKKVLVFTILISCRFFL